MPETDIKPTRYHVLDPFLSELQRRFTYHSPKPDQPERYELLRRKGGELAILIAECVRDSRERATAITKLEEAIFWANAGIARNE